MRVPPGGFAAFGQESPATQALFGKFIRGNGGTRRRAKSGTKKRRKRRAKSSTPRKRRSGGALKKGSAAAKARMAKLRRMRRK